MKDFVKVTPMQGGGNAEVKVEVQPTELPRKTVLNINTVGNKTKEVEIYQNGIINKIKIYANIAKDGLKHKYPDILSFVSSEIYKITINGVQIESLSDGFKQIYAITYGSGYQNNYSIDLILDEHDGKYHNVPLFSIDDTNAASLKLLFYHYLDGSIIRIDLDVSNNFQIDATLYYKDIPTIYIYRETADLAGELTIGNRNITDIQNIFVALGNGKNILKKIYYDTGVIGPILPDYISLTGLHYNSKDEYYYFSIRDINGNQYPIKISRLNITLGGKE